MVRDDWGWPTHSRVRTPCCSCGRLSGFVLVDSEWREGGIRKRLAGRCVPSISRKQSWLYLNYGNVTILRGQQEETERKVAVESGGGECVGRRACTVPFLIRRTSAEPRSVSTTANGASSSRQELGGKVV